MQLSLELSFKVLSHDISLIMATTDHFYKSSFYPLCLILTQQISTPNYLVYAADHTLDWLLPKLLQHVSERVKL